MSVGRETSWGALELELALTPATEANQAPLVILFPKSTTAVTIGRRPGSDIVLQNPCISATHCTVSRCHGSQRSETIDAAGPQPQEEYSFADLSSNGCYVNGVLVGKGRIVPLHPCDRVELVRAAPHKEDKYNMTFVFHAATHAEAARGREKEEEEEDETRLDGRAVDHGAPIKAEHGPSLESPQPITVGPNGGGGVNCNGAAHDDHDELSEAVENVHLDPRDDERIPEAVNVGCANEDDEHVDHSSGDIRRTPDGNETEQEEWRKKRAESVQLMRETTAAFLHRRYASDVHLFFHLDQAPLGEGSFAAVYTAMMKADVADNHHPAVIRKFAQFMGRAEEHHNSNSSCSSDYCAASLATGGGGASAAVSVWDASLVELMFRKKFAVKVIKKNPLLYENDEKNPLLTVDAEQQRLLRLLLGDASAHEPQRLVAASSDDSTTALQPLPPPEGQHIPPQQRSDGFPLTTELRRDILLQLTPQSKKILEREIKSRQRQRREIDILLAVRHQNIVSLFEIFETQRHLSFVMELCEGGELFPLVQSIGALPEFFVKLVVLQVVRGVQYLHRVGIAHRDLKLENVLLANRVPLSSLCQMNRDAALLARHEATQHSRAFAIGAAAAKRDRDGSPVYLRNTGPAATLNSRPVPVAPFCHRPSEAHAAASGSDCIPSDPAAFREWHHSTVLVPFSWWPLVKITDFGLSRTAENTGIMSTMCGTPLYAAPEVTITSLRESAAGYTEAVDLFSIGVLCFAMLCGRPPFPTQRDAYGRPQKGRLDYRAPLTWERKQTSPLPSQTPGLNDGAASTTPTARGDADIADVPFVPVSPAARDFTSRLLRMRPQERLSASEALRHPWLQDCIRLSPNSDVTACPAR